MRGASRKPVLFLCGSTHPCEITDAQFQTTHCYFAILSVIDLAITGDAALFPNWHELVPMSLWIN
jgi:hypothetical protein